MVNQILLVQLSPDQPTSYISGGLTRHTDGSIPHISQVLTVGRLDGAKWRLAPAAATDWTAMQAEWVSLGGEPVRLTDALRDQVHTQAQLRAGYDAWVAAGRPDHNSPRWNARTMRTAFAARPGESFHGCGMSVDIDVGALFFPGLARGSDAALGKFWEIAAKHGWRPIIDDHDASKSEAWHFDHIDSLAAVRELYATNGYRPTYNHVARVANALACTLPVAVNASTEVAYVQARLTLAGQWCGAIDGVFGSLTRAAFKGAGLVLSAKASAAEMVAALNTADLAVDQIGAL